MIKHCYLLGLLKHHTFLLLGGSLLGRLELTALSRINVKDTEVTDTVSERGWTVRTTPVEWLIVDQLGRAHTARDLKVVVFLVIRFLFKGVT